MNRIELFGILDRHLRRDEVERVMSHASPALRLSAERVEPAALRVGASRFGGEPDLPSGFEWPRKSGRPLAFLAQLDLSEFSVFDGVGDLPARGWLCFFYDTEEALWGFDPADRGSWAVRHIDGIGASDLHRTSPPAQTPDAIEPRYSQLPTAFTACRVTAQPTLTVPHLYEHRDELGLENDERFDVLFNAWCEAVGLSHQLLGEAFPIQGDMRLMCQLASSGLYCGDSSAYDTPAARKLTPGAADWRLLLQINSDEDGPGWMWGDCGMVYFMIRRQALAARAFDDVWLVLQCH